MKLFFPTFLILAGVSLIFSNFSLGHALGQSFEKRSNGYMVDVGYSAADNIQTGQTIRFDFNLWIDKESEKIADFSHVWVRIAPQEGISFAGFLHRPELLLTGMSYTFAEAGSYELTVRFLDEEDRAMAEATFPIVVKGNILNLSIGIVYGAIAGLVAGSILVFLIMRRRPSSI